MPSFQTEDPAFRQVLDVARRAARSTANVLITGESGTGKNRMARFIHARSARSPEAFVEVACANLPDELLESELFGHERGAFTGAHDARPGRFEQAHGGTLFLDEIQELAPEIQAKVLRAIEEKRFERLGGEKTQEVDVRILAAMQESPDLLVELGRFRADLYYRLNVVRVDLPPLRERRADIALLARSFLELACAQHKLQPRAFADEVLQRFADYAWPGNVRELRHVVEAAAILSEGDRITLADLPRELSVSGPTMLRRAAAEALSLEQLERAYIAEVLARTRGNKSAAARILGIHRKTLHEKLRSLAEGS